MSNHIQRSLNLPSNQTGATLIIVMMVMLLISLVATVSLKNSNLDLKMATSDQVKKLLFQSSDSAVTKIEKESINGNIDNSANVLGFLKLNPEDQVTFCLRPQQDKLFNISKMTHKIRNTPAGSGLRKDTGYCNPTDSNDFVSARNTSMTQVTVHELSEEEGKKRFRLHLRETNLANRENTVTAKLYKTQTTSIVPVYTDAALGTGTEIDTASVSGCFRQDPNRSGIDTCLQDLGVPYSSHEQIFSQRPEGVSTNM